MHAGTNGLLWETGLRRGVDCKLQNCTMIALTTRPWMIRSVMRGDASEPNRWYSANLGSEDTRWKILPWSTFACADLGLTQACLVAKGPLTWVMVVAAIRRSVRLACRSLPPGWWKGRRFGTNHKPANHEPTDIEWPG